MLGLLTWPKLCVRSQTVSYVISQVSVSRPRLFAVLCKRGRLGRRAVVRAATGIWHDAVKYT